MAKATAPLQVGDTVQIIKDDEYNNKYGVIDEVTPEGTYMVIIGSGSVRHEYKADDLEFDWSF